MIDKEMFEESSTKVISTDGPRFKQRCSPQKAHEYDFLAARPHLEHTNSICESSAHMVKVILGAGVYGVHVGFTKTGVLSGGIIMLIMGILSALAMWSLVHSAQSMYGRIHVPVLTYPDLFEAAMLLSPYPRAKKYARCCRYIVEVTLMLYLISCCGVLHIFLARNCKQLLEGNPYRDSAVIYAQSMKKYVIVVMIPLLLGAMITNLKNLTPFVTTNIAYIVLATGVIVYFGSKNPITADDFTKFRSFGGLCQCLGMCVYSLEGITVALGIENHMTEPKKFPYVVLGSYIFATTVLLTVGIFGYFGFRVKPVAPIFVQFPWTQ
ncbi:neutral amino acid uniporter 4-like [Anticarsia gemmatalis]|uniref:neutral amino acid uniporter 4-like n=1 Tax=Anticarsia gemmatalis TaxID=129554 RepID=UPI003F777675